MSLSDNISIGFSKNLPMRQINRSARGKLPGGDAQARGSDEVISAWIEQMSEA